jgi:enoyl-CoA hydratase/carnithine racemase
MALAADMRVLGRSAKLSLPEITYGLLPDMGGTQTLTAIVGRAKAIYLVMTGHRLSGEEAFAWGIGDWLVDDDAVDARARQIAGELAAHPPQALMMAKNLVDQSCNGKLKRGLRQELTSICTLFKSADYTEARTALREGRAPEYTGL